ncbi:hypothetical protein BGX31_008638 [Mortierella sp. GBA43]|nr:hypothetical protein BGX31_008638 [Mortierella sp. GBA43]
MIRKVNDPDIILKLCYDVDASLSQLIKCARNNEASSVRDVLVPYFFELVRVLESRNYTSEAGIIRKKAEKWRGQAQSRNSVLFSKNPSRISLPATLDYVVGSMVSPISPTSPSTARNFAQPQVIFAYASMPPYIFFENVSPPSIAFKPPRAKMYIDDTLQLACCLNYMRPFEPPNNIQDPSTREWLETVVKDSNERKRLEALATEVIRVFKKDDFKGASAVSEVVHLAPVLEREEYRDLLDVFNKSIKKSLLLHVHQLDGLARLLQGAHGNRINADDLVGMLNLLSNRLQETHLQSTDHVHRLTMTVSRVLDAMVDIGVRGLSREKLHEPLSLYLKFLQENPDPLLVYHAAYAYQALLCVPDDETFWQAALRRTGRVIQGVSGLVTAVRCMDIHKFMESLGTLHQGLDKASALVKNSYKGVIALARGGHTLFSCLRDGMSFELQQAWYPALRAADGLIQEGRLKDFKELVCMAQCRFDPPFQWGVCQRLGEIAADSMWDMRSRESAIAFLGVIYLNDEEWGQQPTIKQWIINILMHLSRDNFQSAGPSAYALRPPSPPLVTPSLIDIAQKRPDVEGSLLNLKEQRIQGRITTIYIPPQAKASLHASDAERQPLMDMAMKFLESEQKVFLLLGDSGGGKSLFNHELELKLWESYEKGIGVIPLYISLPAIDKPEQDMIAKQLRKAEFNDSQIRDLKNTRQFVLICDGYDESQQTHNLYTSNKLNQPHEWQAKMVISCRSDYLGNEYRDQFQPCDRNQRAKAGLLQEAVITPFSEDQIQEYIEKYVSENNTQWGMKDYMEALDRIPSLRDLVRNPFLMNLALEVLPRMVRPGQNLSTASVTRVSLYDEFVELWLERGKKRLRETELGPLEKAAFQSLADEGFMENGVEFMKKLSFAIFKEQSGQPVVEYSRYKDEGSWKEAFFGRGGENQLLRKACPLRRNGNEHRFVHRSLLEYGLARAVFDPQDVKKRKQSTPVSTRRGSVSSIWSIDIEDTTEEVEAVIKLEPNLDSPLAWKYFINEPSILQFLKDRVQQEPLFKQQLLAYIELSKNDKGWRIAAANAITILVKAGFQFIGMDLRGIQIPRADLSYGMFDSAQLQGSDLRRVNLCHAWLLRADLTGAHLGEAQFGELPSLIEDIPQHSCAYSPDGKSFAVGLLNGNISVYTTSSWERLQMIGHAGGVGGLAYSPKGDRIASGGNDKTVRLWDVATGKCYTVLEGHSHQVTSVAYSPQGNLIASGSLDGTVRIWDVETNECRHTMYCRLVGFKSLAFSPNGHQIATGCNDNSVRLWDTETGVSKHILRGHTDQVSSVRYSPLGDLLASGSWDKTVRLWSLGTGKHFKTLRGHTARVTSISYSPQGDQIATGSWDKTVRVWDVETASCHQTLTGHSSDVFCVAYSPKGNQIASGSSDNTVRLWDMCAVAPRHEPSGHSNAVSSVKFSPEGCQITSCGSDNTTRLWNVQTGRCHHTMSGKDLIPGSVAYSHQGRQIACSWNNTVRLLDMDTGDSHRDLSGHSGGVSSIAYSPNGELVATASDDETVRLWNVDTGECHKVLHGHTTWVTHVVYSPNRNQIASGSRDKTIRLWDVETGICTHVLTGHNGKILFIYSPNGNQIASTSMDSTVMLWDTETGSLSYTLCGHDNDVLSIAYSPNGDQLASSSKDCTVKLWDAEDGTLCRTLTGHKSEISSVSYSLDGRLIASGSEDATVRLWDVVSGHCQAIIQDFHGPVNSTAWSRDSDSDVILLATGCGDKSVRLWEVVEGKNTRVRLRWSSTHDVLTLGEASIRDVRGLSPVNRRLLKQRGAVDEPARQI